MSVSGSPESWLGASYQVVDQNGVVVSGSSRLEGNQFSYELQSGQYELGAFYHLNISQQPVSVIDGADITLDLPWQIQPRPFFGQADIRLDGMMPVTVPTGQDRTYTVRGLNLNRVETLILGDRELSSDQFFVSSDGRMLQFNATLLNAGLKGLQVKAGHEFRSLAAAVAVVEAINLAEITSSNSAGNTLLSDNGGDLVTVTGSGLSPDISVHLLQKNGGAQPNSSNAVNFVLAGDSLSFMAPAAVAGFNYQVVIVRASTGEQVAASTLLKGFGRHTSCI